MSDQSKKLADKKYLEANREDINVRRRKRHSEKAEELNAKRRLRYKIDDQFREKARLCAAKSRLANREKVLLGKRLYRQNNLDHIKATSRAYYQKYRARLLANSRKYRTENSDYLKQYHREHYSKNKVRISEQSKKRRLEHPGIKRKRDHDYYLKNSAKIKATIAIWVANNHEYVKEQARIRGKLPRDRTKQRARNALWNKNSPARKAWREKNREKLNAYWREYYKRNPHRRAYLAWKRKQKKGISIVLDKWVSIGKLCYICGLEIAEKYISIEHVWPRIKGGTNDSYNLMPAHKRCNSVKRDRINIDLARPDLLGVCCG